MKHSLRLVSLLLAGLLMIACLAACGTGEPSGKETAAGDTSSDTTPETDPLEDALTSIREQVDWGGEDFGILYVNDIGGYTEEVEAEEAGGTADSSGTGVVSAAVFDRNTAFEEYCNLNFVLIPKANNAIGTSLQGEVQTGAGDFQLVTRTTEGTAADATAGRLYDYLALEGIDYETAWWDRGTLDFALKGRVYFMNGPFNIVDDDVTFVMMFNKVLRENNKIENPYDTVKQNRWTLEYFNSLLAGMAADNGDGTWDEKDTYGFSTPGSIGNTFFYGAGLQYVKNDRDMDSPELLLTDTNMDRALDTLEIARKIIHDNNSSYVARQGDEALSRDIFTQGRSLFYCEAASYLRHLNSEMTDEYGVLPIPKYSTDQENYTTWSHSIGSTLSIPTSVASGDLEQFALVLETYVMLSQKYVRPAYYDTLLTVRNVHDSESAEIVNIIFENRIYDMAMYFTEFGFGDLFSSSVSGENTFSSSYASASKNFDQRLTRLLKKLD